VLTIRDRRWIFFPPSSVQTPPTRCPPPPQPPTFGGRHSFENQRFCLRFFSFWILSFYDTCQTHGVSSTTPTDIPKSRNHYFFPPPFLLLFATNLTTPHSAHGPPALEEYSPPYPLSSSPPAFVLQSHSLPVLQFGRVLPHKPCIRLFPFFFSVRIVNLHPFFIVRAQGSGAVSRFSVFFPPSTATRLIFPATSNHPCPLLPRSRKQTNAALFLMPPPRG